MSTPSAGISAPKVPPIWVALMPVEKRTRKLANCRIERVVVTNSGENARAFGALAEERHQTVAKARPLKITVRQHRKEFRSEEHTSELQSLMRRSYAVFSLK